MNYSLSEIATICGGTLQGVDFKVDTVCTDSRNIRVSNSPLFVAMSGLYHDGHDYISDLYDKGCRAFLVDNVDKIHGVRELECSFVVVDNTLKAIQCLAASHRANFKGVVVAVTGSNGKTIVKEWATTLLSKSMRVFRSPKSYNSQIGVPLSVLMLNGDEDIAIIEAGISKMDEMVNLQKIINPDIALFTTIGDAHQDNFVSLENKIEEKLILFKGCHTIIYNGNYGKVKNGIITQFGDRELIDSSQIEVRHPRITDSSSVDNIAMSIALCKAVGCWGEKQEFALEDLQPVAMRLDLKEGINDSLIVNDSYNSDINSLSIALDYLSSVSGSKSKMLILSDILQSGYSEDKLYKLVAKLVNGSGIDMLFGIGKSINKYASLFNCKSQFYSSTDSFLSDIHREDIANRAILLKGSRDSQFERISHFLERKSHTTTLEIDLDAIINNLNIHRSKISPSTKMMAMVKASGYGNGAFELAKVLQHQRVDYLAVAFADEGVLLREHGITMPIVVLNADADSFDIMIANRLEPEIYNFSSLHSFVRVLERYSERDYSIHLKLDTGMHRLGFIKEDLPKLVDEIESAKNLIYINSIFSHLAASDEPMEREFTQFQIANFREMSTVISDTLKYAPLKHIANSAAIQLFPEAEFDMVRLGIGLYGISSSADVRLDNVSTLKSRIVQIKELGDGDTVGYGRAGCLTKVTRIATIPIGYADGLNRHLGCGAWSVIIKGEKAVIVGRICMDTCMIDVTGIDCCEGDEVTIFGADKGNTVSDMAAVIDTIPYEIMTSISMRVKRIYTKR